MPNQEISFLTASIAWKFKCVQIVLATITWTFQIKHSSSSPQNALMSALTPLNTNCLPRTRNSASNSASVISAACTFSTKTGRPITSRQSKTPLKFENDITKFTMISHLSSGTARNTEYSYSTVIKDVKSCALYCSLYQKILYLSIFCVSLLTSRNFFIVGLSQCIYF